MATNRVFESSEILSVVCTHPTTPAAGDPVRWGNRIGVALTDEGASVSGETTVQFGGVYELSVKGEAGGGNSAVSVGDAIFYTDGDTPVLNKKASGYFAGFALETVSSGATTTIKVAMADSPGSGALGSGTVGETQLAADSVVTAKIADDAVTVAKLDGNLQIGFIPLPLTAFRLIASNDIPNSGAADGGTISKDTVPKLERINGATDKQLRIAWAATEIIGITTQFAYPTDLDDGADVDVHLMYYKNANANAAMVAAVGYFEGIGDTNAGGNTASLTGTTATNVSVTIAAGNIGAAPKVATIDIVPGAHANDALYLIGAWISYVRKG
jgi:hypothetical protein